MISFIGNVKNRKLHTDRLDYLLPGESEREVWDGLLLSLKLLSGTLKLDSNDYCITITSQIYQKYH